jgi:hypothetical protein
MSSVYVGERLKDFSYVEGRPTQLEPIKWFSTEQIGQTTESFVCNLITHLFNGVVMRVPSGSPLDLKGVDLLVRGKGPTLGLQVKSSKCGYESFLSHPSCFYEEVLVTWVDIQSWVSRKALFLGLFPVLKANGILPKRFLIELILKRDKFIKKGIKVLPVRRGVVSGFTCEEVTILCAIGLCHMDKGMFVLV